MSDIIKIKPNEDGRAIANLYGTDFDLTEMADENGKGEFKAFNKTYQFEITQSKKKVKKAIKAEETEDNE